MCAAARARARALSMFIPKHMPHLCGTEIGVHGGVPQRHLLQRHLRNSKRRQSPRASCARRARALRSAAQSTAATVIVNSRSPCWGARGRCRSGAQRAPGSPACSIVASCPAASGAMTATSTRCDRDDDSICAITFVFNKKKRLLDTMVFECVASSMCVCTAYKGLIHRSFLDNTFYSSELRSTMVFERSRGVP